MYIDFNRLRDKGFDVRPDKDGVEIQPHHTRDPQELVAMLRDDFKLLSMYAWDLVEKVHTYQIISAICD